MSHLAEALRRAHPDLVARDVFRDDDHPWGDQLGTAAADAPESPRTLETGSRERQQPGAAAAHPLPPPRPAPLGEPAVVHGPSWDTGLGPGARQQIAGLIERVFLPVSEAAPRVVAFASVGADDSSSPIAARAGAMLAQRTGARVGVIDLNFAKPSIHECFAISNAPGLMEAFGTDAPLVSAARQVHANLWVIPAGHSTASVELSEGSRTRLSHLTAAFDHVVIALAPLADCFGPGLAAIADGIILVIDAETTRRDTGRTVTERLQASGAAILGAVLTNRRYPIPGAIYRRL